MKNILLAVIIVLSAATANAYVLDWTAVDYAAGATYQQFANIGGSGINMDFQWVDGAPGGLANMYSGLPDDDALTTQYPSAAPGLWYATNNGGDVSVVITFSQVVSDICFSIYDIDGATANMEKVRIKGFDINDNPVDIGSYCWFNNGNEIGVTVGNAAFGVEFANLAGVDLNPGQAGWEKNQALIGIDSGAQIKKLGIAFTNLDGVRGQIIENISFVPEPTTMVLLALGGLLLGRKK